MMKEQLQAIREEALKAVKDSADMKEIDALRVKFLGKKGELTAILKQMGGLSAEEDLHEPLSASLKKRMPWLLVLLVLGMSDSLQTISAVILRMQ